MTLVYCTNRSKSVFDFFYLENVPDRSVPNPTELFTLRSRPTDMSINAHNNILLENTQRQYTNFL